MIVLRYMARGSRELRMCHYLVLVNWHDTLSCTFIKE